MQLLIFADHLSCTAGGHIRITREREVVIGARNDTDVVVVKGLEEGEEVVISESLPGAAK